MLDRVARRFVDRSLIQTAPSNGVKHDIPSLYPLPSRSVFTFATLGDVAELSRQTAIAASVYCYAAIRYRSQNVAEPEIVLFEKTEDGDQVVTDHPDLDLLQEPSPDFDQGELVEITQMYWDIDGSALWVLDEGMDGMPAQIVPLAGSEFTVTPAMGRLYGRFDLTNLRSGKSIRYPDEVVYFRFPNPNDRWSGLSPTDVALSWLGLGSQVKASIKSLLRNAMFPSVVISTDPEWNPDDDEFERFKREIFDFYTGERNAGKPFVNLGGGRVDRVSYTLGELVPKDVLDRVESVVASVYGIAPVILGWQVGLENSPWSQMQEARQFTYEDTIVPLWRRIGKTLDRQMPGDRDPKVFKYGFDLRNVRALQEDEKEKAEIAVALSNIWTRDELRAYTGKDPHPDPMIGEAIPDRDKAPTTSVSMGGSSDGKSERYSADETIALVEFDVETKAQEPMWTRVVLAALRDQRKKAVSLFTSTVRPASKAGDDIPDPASLTEFARLFAKWLEDEGNKRLRDAVLPLIESTAESAVRRVSAKIGVAFDILLEGLGDFVEKRAEFLSEVMGETTGAAVTSGMKRAVRDGDLILDIAKTLEDLPEFDRHRAVRVARTETTAVLNGAQRTSISEYAKEHPERVVMKTWVTALDERVREAHRALHGKQIGIDEEFSNGRTEPGEPNCRCTLTYEIAEALG